MRVRAGVAATLMCGMLVGCTAPSEGRLYGVSTASVELQRNALLECRDSLGYAGQTLSLDTEFRARQYEENIYRLRAVAGGEIDSAAAQRINTCADTTLTARFGTDRPMVGPQDVAATVRPMQSGAVYTASASPAPAANTDYRQRLLSGTNRQPTGSHSISCQPGAPVIYGGKLYCLKR